MRISRFLYLCIFIAYLCKIPYFPPRGFLTFLHIYAFLLYIAFFGLLGHYRACQAFNSFNTYNRRNLTNFSDFCCFCQVWRLYIGGIGGNFLTFRARRVVIHPHPPNKLIFTPKTPKKLEKPSKICYNYS